MLGGKSWEEWIGRYGQSRQASRVPPRLAFPVRGTEMVVGKNQRSRLRSESHTDTDQEPYRVGSLPIDAEGRRLIHALE